MIKFNDAAGDADQQHCENICGITDATTAITDRNGIDIYYEVLNAEGTDTVNVCVGYGKCGACPYLYNHAGVTLE